MENAKQEKGQEAVLATVAQIEKQYGKGAIMRLGEGVAPVEVPVTSTGSLGLDIALGIGGLPRGRIVEVYGPESSGKTTLALSVIAEAQRSGGVCAFIDAEHALDLGYAQRLGVKTGDLLLSQPDHGEQALEICDLLVRSGAVDVVVIDSVAALVPRAELEGDVGEAHPGLHARLMSQALRKLAAACARSRTLVLFTNQLRVRLGVTFGNPETTTGGNALKFFASVRLDIRRVGTIKDGENVIGCRTRVKVAKNKLAVPFKEAEFDVRYGQGISRAGEILDLAIEAGLIEKNGARLSYGTEQLGRSREAARWYLVGRQELLRELRARLLEKAGLQRRAASPAQGTESSPERSAAAA